MSTSKKVQRAHSKYCHSKCLTPTTKELNDRLRVLIEKRKSLFSPQSRKRKTIHRGTNNSRNSSKVQSLNSNHDTQKEIVTIDNHFYSPKEIDFDCRFSPAQNSRQNLLNEDESTKKKQINDFDFEELSMSLANLHLNQSSAYMSQKKCFNIDATKLRKSNTDSIDSVHHFVIPPISYPFHSITENAVSIQCNCDDNKSDLVLSKKIDIIEASSSIPNLEYEVLCFENKTDHLMVQIKEKDVIINSLKEMIEHLTNHFKENQKIYTQDETEEFQSNMRVDWSPNYNSYVMEVGYVKTMPEIDKCLESESTRKEKPAFEQKSKVKHFELENLSKKLIEEEKSFSQYRADLHEAREENLVLRLQLGKVTKQLEGIIKNKTHENRKRPLGNDSAYMNSLDKNASIQNNESLWVNDGDRKADQKEKNACEFKLGIQSRVKQKQSLNEELVLMKRTLQGLKNDIQLMKKTSLEEFRNAKDTIQGSCNDVLSYVMEEVYENEIFIEEVTENRSNESQQNGILRETNKILSSIKDDFMRLNLDIVTRIDDLEQRLLQKLNTANLTTEEDLKSPRPKSTLNLWNKLKSYFFKIVSGRLIYNEVEERNTQTFLKKCSYFNLVQIERHKDRDIENEIFYDTYAM